MRVKDLGLAVLAVLTPIHAMLIATAFLVLVELLTSLLAAYHRGEPVAWARMGRSMANLLIFEGVIVVSFVVEVYMTNSLPFIKIATTFIGITELRAILENLSLLSGQDQGPLRTFLKYVGGGGGGNPPKEPPPSPPTPSSLGGGGGAV